MIYYSPESMSILKTPEAVEYFAVQKAAFLHVREVILEKRVPERVKRSIGYEFRTDEAEPIPHIVPYKPIILGSQAYNRTIEPAYETIQRWWKDATCIRTVVKPEGDRSDCRKLLYFDPSLMKLSDLERTDITRGAFAYAFAKLKKDILHVRSPHFIENTCRAAGLENQLQAFKTYNSLEK